MTRAQKQWLQYFKATEDARIKQPYYRKSGIVLPVYKLIPQSVIDFLKAELKLQEPNAIVYHGCSLFVKPEDLSKYGG
jgi:hypothetical protein